MKIKVIQFLIFFAVGIVFGQTLDSSQHPVLTQSTKKIDSKLKTIYTIKCNFSAELSGNELNIAKNPANWQVRGENKVYTITDIQFPLKKITCTLIGNWDISDNLFLVFNNQAEVNVNTKDATGATTKWGFGKGQAFDFNIQLWPNRKAFMPLNTILRLKL